MNDTVKAEMGTAKYHTVKEVYDYLTQSKK